MAESPKHYTNALLQYLPGIVGAGVIVAGFAGALAVERARGGTVQTFVANNLIVLIIAVAAACLFLAFLLYGAVRSRAARRGARWLTRGSDIVLLSSGLGGLTGDLQLAGIDARIPSWALMTVDSEGVRFWSVNRTPRLVAHLDWGIIRGFEKARTVPPPFYVQGLAIQLDGVDGPARVTVPIYSMDVWFRGVTSAWRDYAVQQAECLRRAALGGAST